GALAHRPLARCRLRRLPLEAVLGHGAAREREARRPPRGGPPAEAGGRGAPAQDGERDRPRAPDAFAAADLAPRRSGRPTAPTRPGSRRGRTGPAPTADRTRATAACTFPTTRCAGSTPGYRTTRR